MIKHYISKYTSDNKQYVASWLQINMLGKIFCFSKKVIEL